MGAVLRIAPMRRLWYAQVVSTFGDFIALFAVMTLMTFNLHATPQQITGVQIAYMLPIAVLGVISGVFVDRWPLKPTMVSSDLIRAALCLLLISVHTVWGYYFVLASISIVSSVFTPAQGIAVRTAVPMHGMRSAQALMQQVMFIMRVVGGPLASFLVTRFTAKSCFIIDAISFVASGCLIASVALKLAAKSAVVLPVDGKSAVMITSDKPEKTGLVRVLDDMQQGLSFFFQHAGLLFIIVAMAAAMFVMGCFAPLIAVYVRDTLHATPRAFGVTSAMIGIGLMLGINFPHGPCEKDFQQCADLLRPWRHGRRHRIPCRHTAHCCGPGRALRRRLRCRRNHCAGADHDSAGDTAGDAGSRWVDTDVLDLQRADRRPHPEWHSC